MRWLAPVLGASLLFTAGCPTSPYQFDSGATGTTPTAQLPTGGTTAPTTGGTLSECAQAGFRAPTQGLSGPALADALRTLTNAHDCDDYTGATIFLFTRLDKVNDQVECVYTGRTTAVTTYKPAEDDMNTEHTWPQSQGADTYPARCDLHHLYPADSDVNAQRGSFDFGEVTGTVLFEQGGSKLGQSAAGTVFEPRDVHKGNVARSMLYVQFRYGATLSATEKSTFQQWSADDPPDAAEIARTQAIADRQGAANPLVLCPDLVDRL